MGDVVEVPVIRLSRQITRWPRDSSRSVRWEPRKPAPPVTTEVGWVVVEAMRVSLLRVHEHDKKHGPCKGDQPPDGGESAMYGYIRPTNSCIP
jgi:CRISPR/Cas system-associated protein Csm6